jgi:hypothetical protein
MESRFLKILLTFPFQRGAKPLFFIPPSLKPQGRGTKGDRLQ